MLNPGGSVKDRVALQIVQEALAEGRLTPGGLITEGTAGAASLPACMYRLPAGAAECSKLQTPAHGTYLFADIRDGRHRETSQSRPGGDSLLSLPMDMQHSWLGVGLKHSAAPWPAVAFAPAGT